MNSSNLGATASSHVFYVSSMIACLLCGCQTPFGSSLPSTQTDRLVAAYDDLKSARRFVVVADFEDPTHMNLVRLIASSDAARCERSYNGGRAETGRNALRFRAGTEADTVVFSNTESSEWYLKRDWRDYDLLMMAVRAERSSVDLVVSTSGGTDAARATVQTRVRLNQGWNIVRLDLADIGARVPLDDMREIRLSVFADDKPATIFVDDLILASNRADVLGDSANSEGELYIRQAGRRWFVGAGGRFELGFANGQIVAWFDLLHDPLRRRNLVGDNALGPTPLMFTPDGSEAISSAPAGTPVEVHPRIIEASSMRVVVTCDWRVADLRGEVKDTNPIYGWRYTIYATGQVFATVSQRTDGVATDKDNPPRVGIAANLGAFTDDAVQIHAAQELTPPSYALVRSQPGGYGFLFAIDDVCRMKVIRSRAHEQQRPVTILGFRGSQGGAIENWSCQMALSTAEDLTEDAARRRAEAYVDPPAPSMQVGSLLLGGPSRVFTHGFDSGSGSYVVVPQDGRIKMSVGGASHHWFNPVFTVEDSINQQAWVYVDHVLLPRVERDRFGRLVFQLDGTVESSRLVEVLLRPRDS